MSPRSPLRVLSSFSLSRTSTLCWTFALRTYTQTFTHSRNSTRDFCSSQDLYFYSLQFSQTFALSRTYTWTFTYSRNSTQTFIHIRTFTRDFCSLQNFYSLQFFQSFALS